MYVQFTLALTAFAHLVNNCIKYTVVSISVFSISVCSPGMHLFGKQVDVVGDSVECVSLGLVVVVLFRHWPCSWCTIGHVISVCHLPNKFT